MNRAHPTKAPIFKASMRFIPHVIGALLLNLSGLVQALPQASLSFHYGPEPAQMLDVYLPKKPQLAPVLVIIHGGAWRRGDKQSSGLLSHKLAHWLPRGFILVSVNYRLLPGANPLQQAQDLASALTFIEQQAAQWQGDPRQIVALGHSAGAHLLALVSANPARYQTLGLTPWRGSILLDSAALDVPKIMQAKHLRLYDRAFGSGSLWVQASPIDQLSAQAIPMLLVCSSKRSDSCPQAQAFSAKASKLNIPATVAAEPLSHRQINVELGEDSAYTQRVEDFITQQLKAP